MAALDGASSSRRLVCFITTQTCACCVFWHRDKKTYAMMVCFITFQNGCLGSLLAPVANHYVRSEHDCLENE
jgi:hypothetical protein